MSRGVRDASGSGRVGYLYPITSPSPPVASERRGGADAYTASTADSADSADSADRAEGHDGAPTAPCPLDHVNRNFKAPAPNRLWVSDFTYVSAWAGFVYVAFVIDVFARRIVGWRVSRTAHAGFALDALELALHDRRPGIGSGRVHHSDRGSQYVSLRYTGRLAEAGLEPSVGSVGDSYDNALAETINGLYKAEVIWQTGPWKSPDTIEFATLDWVDWFNHRRLARADRQYSAGRSRGQLLCSTQGKRYRCMTQTKQPPGLTARFTVRVGVGLGEL